MSNPCSVDEESDVKSLLETVSLAIVQLYPSTVEEPRTGVH